MLCILDMGGFTTGGVNFDAKVRRESYEPIDLFHAHIGGMDAFARGLKVAHAIQQDGRLSAFVKERYKSWDGELGRRDRGRPVLASPTSRTTSSPRATSPPTRAAGRRCSRT